MWRTRKSGGGASASSSTSGSLPLAGRTLPLIGPPNAVGVRSEKAGQSSRFRGVSWDVSNKTWNVRIRVDGENTRIGCFSDEEKAGRAFDKYIVDNNLDRPLNFPVAAEEEDDESSSEGENEESRGSASLAPNEDGEKRVENRDAVDLEQSGSIL